MSHYDAASFLHRPHEIGHVVGNRSKDTLDGLGWVPCPQLPRALRRHVIQIKPSIIRPILAVLRCIGNGPVELVEFDDSSLSLKPVLDGI